jgi:rhodanese-related sulfurtransferase
MPLPEFAQICEEAKKQIQEIDIAGLKRMQQAGEDFELIDVREADEVQRGTIPGAKALARGILERDIDQITTDRNRKMVLYCGGGNRSALAAVNLQKMGYKNVISLAGGWKAWQQQK